MKIILIIFLFIEIIAHIVAFREIALMVWRRLEKYVDKTLTRCVEDISYRNKIASKIFFFSRYGAKYFFLLNYIFFYYRFRKDHNLDCCVHNWL